MQCRIICNPFFSIERELPREASLSLRRLLLRKGAACFRTLPFYNPEIVIEIQKLGGIKKYILYFDYNIAQETTFGNIFLVQIYGKIL